MVVFQNVSWGDRMALCSKKKDDIKMVTSAI
jgi:hypothetical protein